MPLVRDATGGLRVLIHEGPAAFVRRVAARQGPIAFGRMQVFEARRAVARRLPRHPFLKAHPPVGDLLAMTTPEEQSWLYDFARRSYRGLGDIADLGSWLGSSSIALAQGLVENVVVADKDGRIHAFDLFLWDEWMESRYASTGLVAHVAPGASFLPQFDERVERWAELIVTHPGDLCEVGWPSGRPLELVFNDASKTLALCNSIRRDFLPHLLPGEGILVEQDFAHYFTPWVHLSQWRLREYFTPVVHVPYSGSMVFRLERPIPADLLVPLTLDEFDDDEVEAAFDRSLGLVERPMRPNIWAARVMLDVHRGRPEDARRLLDDGRRRGYHGLDLDDVRRALPPPPG